MAGAGAVDPNYNNIDPYDDGPFTEEAFLHIFSNPNPNLTDLSLNDANYTDLLNNVPLEPLVINDDIYSGNSPEEINNNKNNLDLNVVGDPPPSPEHETPNCETNEVDRKIDDEILSWYGDYNDDDNVISNPADLSLIDPNSVDQANVNVSPPETLVTSDNITCGNNQEEINNNLDLDVIGDPPLPELATPNCETNEVDTPFFDDRTLSWFGDGNENSNVGDFSGGDNMEGTSNAGPERSRWRMETHMSHYVVGETYVTRRPEPPFVCNCCEVLRELIHTNGQDIMRLEIHGKIGFICYIALEIQPNAAVCEEYRYQIFHFRNRSLEEVKQFLQQYCQERAEAGFIMVQDSLASFYQLMSIGSDIDENIADAVDDFIDTDLQPQPHPQPQPLAIGPPEFASAVEPITVRPDRAEASRDREKKKTPLAVQRERTGKLTLKDVGKYFHLPIQEAARKMKLCPTVVKKICRKGGLARWPHRKIKSVERRISSWRSVLRTSKNPEERARAEAEIKRLENEIESIRAEALKNFPMQ